MDQLEALDISDSNVALLFGKVVLKGVILPLKYDADGAAILTIHLTNKEIQVGNLPVTYYVALATQQHTSLSPYRVVDPYGSTNTFR